MPFVTAGRSIRLLVGAVTALLLTACDSASRPGIAVHMKQGSERFECAEIAHYNVSAAARILAPKKGHDTPADLQRAGQASFAAIKDAAEQLPANDPVRAQALKYVARGRTYPYFAPCMREMYLADVGELKVPNR